MTKTRTQENFEKRLASQQALDTYYKQLHHQAAMEFTKVMLKNDIAEMAAEAGIRAANVFINQLKLQESRDEKD